MSEKLHVLHAPEDVDLVGHVVDFLEAAFPSCRLTCTSFAGYKANPEKALRDADAVVAVISRGALLAATVPFELGVARTLGKPAIIITDDSADPTRLVLPLSSEHVALAETEESLLAVGRRLAATLGVPFRLGGHGSDPELTPAPLPSTQPPAAAIAQLTDEQRLRRSSAESRAANDGTLTGIPLVKPAPFPRAQPTPQAALSPLTEIEIKAKAKVVEEAVAKAVAAKAQRDREQGARSRSSTAPTLRITRKPPAPADTAAKSAPLVTPSKSTGRLPTTRRRRSSAPLPWNVNPTHASPTTHPPTEKPAAERGIVDPSAKTNASDNTVHDRITPQVGTLAASGAARPQPGQTAGLSPAPLTPSPLESFEAGRALGECLFHRSESAPSAAELDPTFGVFINKLNGNWSQLREEANLDLWRKTAGERLGHLPPAAAPLSIWYELGIELSTLIGLSGYEDAQNDEGTAARWQSAMLGLTARAHGLDWSPSQIAVIEGMLENLRGPSDERDYTYVNKIQSTVRDIAGDEGGRAATSASS